MKINRRSEILSLIKSLRLQTQYIQNSFAPWRLPTVFSGAFIPLINRKASEFQLKYLFYHFTADGFGNPAH